MNNSHTELFHKTQQPIVLEIKVISKKGQLIPAHFPPACHSRSTPILKPSPLRNPALWTMFNSHPGFFHTPQETHSAKPMKGHSSCHPGSCRRNSSKPAPWLPVSSCYSSQKHKACSELRDPCSSGAASQSVLHRLLNHDGEMQGHRLL